MIISSRAVIGAGSVSVVGVGLAMLLAVTVSAQGAGGGANRPSVALVAQLTPGNGPRDASPDPAGKVIYFTADGVGGPVISRVSAGSSHPQTLLAGPPLRGPVGLAVSSDGRQLFVADPRAGRIFVVATAGGSVHALRGTAGTAPQGLEVQRLGGRDYVVFTGRDAGTRRPAVLRIPAAGATHPSVLAEGGQLRRPDGVSVSRSGAVYVTDQGGGGRALRIQAGRVTTVAGGIRLGRPAGIALTLDESRLLISSLNPTRRTAQVLILDTRTGRTSTFDNVIGANRDPGGLHRAQAATTVAWADISRGRISSGPAGGKVYRIEP